MQKSRRRVLKGLAAAPIIGLSQHGSAHAFAPYCAGESVGFKRWLHWGMADIST